MSKPVNCLEKELQAKIKKYEKTLLTALTAEARSAFEKRLTRAREDLEHLSRVKA